MALRVLKPGERIPKGKPRRYPNVHGYIRLRWTVAPGEEVEVLEHRVVNGRVTEAPHVHHIDGNKANNDPSNLLHVTPTEHHRHHRVVDREKVLDLYLNQNMSTVEVGEQLGCNHGTVYRILQEQGITPRDRSEAQRFQLDEGMIRRLHLAGVRSRRIARALGVSATPVEATIERLGLPPHRPGRPTNAEIRRANAALKREGLA